MSSVQNNTTEANLEKVIDALENGITMLPSKDSESSEIVNLTNEGNKVFSKNSDENLFEKEQREAKANDDGGHANDSEDAKKRGFRVGVKSDCNVFYRRTMEVW